MVIEGTTFLTDRITRNPAVLGGKPVIRGLRIPVELILDFLANGDSVEDILDAYPSLEREDIDDVVAFGNAEAERTEIRPFSVPVG